jgi:hypothetical protein
LYGYDEARLQGGQSLVREARAMLLEQQQPPESSPMARVTPELKAAWQNADTAYSHALKVARVAFRPTPPAYPLLMLGGPRKLSLHGWLEQATTFYSKLLDNDNLLARMARFGYDRPKLEEEAELVRAVTDLMASQAQEIDSDADSSDGGKDGPVG